LAGRCLRHGRNSCQGRMFRRSDFSLGSTHRRQASIGSAVLRLRRMCSC
jgi:hypothetical protein